MMTHDEIIAVVTAHRDGAEVEYQHYGGQWRFVNTPLWEFAGCNYRAKPEPIVRWVNIYPHSKSYGYETKQAADSSAGQSRIRCIKMVEEVQS